MNQLKNHLIKQLNEHIGSDLITWAGDKNLADREVSQMCQIVVDRLKDFEEDTEEVFSYSLSSSNTNHSPNFE